MRSTTQAELEAILELEKDKANSKFILPNSREVHQAALLNRDVEYFTIKDSEKAIVGFVILAGLQNNYGSIELRRIVIKQKGKGHGRWAIRAIKQYCFEKMNCQRLWLDVIVGNTVARNLYASEGFIEEGILRACLWVNGAFVDLVLMSMLKSEYSR